jgi:integrase
MTEATRILRPTEEATAGALLLDDVAAARLTPAQATRESKRLDEDRHEGAERRQSSSAPNETDEATPTATKDIGHYRIEGFGRAYRRGRRWWIRYWRRPGREVREPARTTDGRVAYRLLRRRHGEIAGGTFVGPKEERVTFEHLKLALLGKYELQGRRSLSTAKLRLRHLAGFFGEDRALDMTTARLEAYQAHRRREKASPATVNRELSLLHRAFVLAAKAALLSRVPMFPDPLEESPPREVTLEAPEYLAIRAHLGPDYQDALDFAYETGWRKGAILRLPWTAVDLRAGTILLSADLAKNKQAQVLPLSSRLREILVRRAERRRLDCPLVFHVDRRPMYHAWQKVWVTACEAAGLAGKRLHDTRRTMSRDLRKSGVVETTAMRMTGHKSAVMFKRYAVVRDTDLDDAADRLAAYRASLPTERTVIPLAEVQERRR